MWLSFNGIKKARYLVGPKLYYLYNKLKIIGYVVNLKERNFNKAKMDNMKLLLQNINIENGVIKLDDNYKQALCYVYSIDGRLILTKQEGISSISTQYFKPGVYILQPINKLNLKNYKFVIIH